MHIHTYISTLAQLRVDTPWRGTASLVLVPALGAYLFFLVRSLVRWIRIFCNKVSYCIY